VAAFPETAEVTAFLLMDELSSLKTLHFSKSQAIDSVTLQESPIFNSLEISDPAYWNLHMHKSLSKLENSAAYHKEPA
jgi:hypothetical protein